MTIFLGMFLGARTARPRKVVSYVAPEGAPSADEPNCWRSVIEGRRSVKGIRVGVALKKASKCAMKSVNVRLVPANQHFNGHLTATLARIPLTDEPKRLRGAK